MPAETETTRRTKQVISDWSGFEVKVITLDARLSRLRTNHLEELRRGMNREFSGEGAFPITSEEWEEADPKAVRDVRDLADKKLEQVPA
jgi:hypothetical protein